MIEKILDFLKTLTWTKYTLSMIAIISGIVLFTMYENRQKVYDRLQPQLYAVDYPLEKPGSEGQKIIAELMAKHPEIALITIIDADPVRNMRVPVYRMFNDLELERTIREAERNGNSGSGPLFSSNEEANKQVIAIMNGEFSCAVVDAGFFANMFPGVVSDVKHSCRVPLPPAFNKATGWFSIHLNKWPAGKGYDTLKYDALSMSLNYFNAEIAAKHDTRDANGNKK